jgi:Na+/melibiose symporter-like transporter
MVWGAIGGSAIVSGIALALFNFFLLRKDKKDDDRAKTAQRESIIIMKNSFFTRVLRAYKANLTAYNITHPQESGTDQSNNKVNDHVKNRNNYF